MWKFAAGWVGDPLPTFIAPHSFSHFLGNRYHCHGGRTDGDDGSLTEVMQLDESLMPDQIDQEAMQITSSIHEMLGCTEVASSIKVFDAKSHASIELL